MIYENTFDWAAASPVDLRSTDRVDGVDFVLPEGNWFRGLVRDFATGSPMEGVSVVASAVPGGSDAPTVWTRGDGSYDGSLPSGAYTIRAAWPGYLTAYYNGAHRPADAAEVIVSATSSPENIDFAMVTVDGDADDDGMPNAWEAQEGLDPTAWNAEDDPDHDGASNLHEYLAGTRPRDRTSVLQARIEPSGVARWSVVPDRTYRIHSADAPSGPWGERHVAVSSAEGWLEWSDPTAPGASRRFYKIGVDPK